MIWEGGSRDHLWSREEELQNRYDRDPAYQQLWHRSEPGSHHSGISNYVICNICDSILNPEDSGMTWEDLHEHITSHFDKTGLILLELTGRVETIQ